MEIFKKDEAKLTRRIAFFGLMVFVLWGARELGRWLSDFKWFKQTLGIDFELPYYEIPLTIGVLISLVVMVGGSIWLFRFLNGERMGSLLIETEGEMKRVSWPSWADTRQSTSIVMIFVIAVAVYLTGIEVILKTVFTRLFTL